MEDADLDEVCSICLAEMEAEESCKELRCFHCFHADCLDGWLRIENTCPLCKAKFHVATPLLLLLPLFFFLFFLFFLFLYPFLLDLAWHTLQPL